MGRGKGDAGSTTEDVLSIPAWLVQTANLLLPTSPHKLATGWNRFCRMSQALHQARHIPLREQTPWAVEDEAAGHGYNAASRERVKPRYNTVLHIGTHFR